MIDGVRPHSGNKDIKILKLLSKMAEDVVPVRSARIASAIVIKGDIISFGINQMKTHPFQAKFSRNNQALYMHSENEAVWKALKRVSKEDLTNSTLYVCRRKRIESNKPGFAFGLACPCEGCMKTISTFKIPRVVYTLDETPMYGFNYGVIEA